MNRFNYNQDGELPDGGAPIFADDLGMLDFRVTETIKALLDGLTKFDGSRFDTVGLQNGTYNNYIIYGCEGTVTNVSGTTYNVAITPGYAMIENEVVEVDAQNIDFDYPYPTTTNPSLVLVKLAKNTTNINRVFENSATEVAKVVTSGYLTTDTNVSGISFNLSSNSLQVDRLVDIVNAYQINQTPRIFEIGELLLPRQKVWKYAFPSNNVLGKCVIEKTSNGLIHYHIPFKLIDAAAHVSNSDKSVVKPPSRFAFPDRYLGNYYFPLTRVQSGGEVDNKAIGWIDSNGFINISGDGNTIFQDDDVFYVNLTLSYR